MKKILIGIIFTGLMVSLNYSCKKEEINKNTNGKSKYTAEELSIWHKLVNFNKIVKSGVRDEEFITPDSAMWYLEALFNVTQATDTTYEEMDLDTNYYSLPLNLNGMVNMNDVIAVYNQMVTDLNTYLSSRPELYKYLIVGDVFQISSRDNGFYFGVEDSYGINPLICYDSLGEEDDWYYGNMLGRCDGQYIWESDAGMELSKRFNNPYNCVQNYSGDTVQIEIETKIVTPEMYSDYIFHKIDTNAPCIDDDHMRYYLSKGHSEIIYKYVDDGGQRPAGKDFVSMILWTNNPNPSNNYYFHKYSLKYAKIIVMPPIPE